VGGGVGGGGRGRGEGGVGGRGGGGMGEGEGGGVGGFGRGGGRKSEVGARKPKTFVANKREGMGKGYRLWAKRRRGSNLKRRKKGQN